MTAVPTVQASKYKLLANELNEADYPRWADDDPRVAELIRHRRMGLYTTEETLSDLYRALKDCNPEDCAVTLHIGKGGMCMLNNLELQSEVKRWKKMGVKMRACNAWEFKVDGKPHYMLILQDPKWTDESPGAQWSPLALALGVMVSGFAYVCRRKETADWLLRQMK